MFWRGDKDKDSNVNKTDNRIDTGHDEKKLDPEKEELLIQNEEARKMFEDIQALRSSVNSLRGSEDTQKAADGYESEKSDIYLKETEAIKAAKQAIVEQAKKDAREERKRREEAVQKELLLKRQQQQILEAQRRAALIEKEAEQKRLEAVKAEKHAREIALKKALGDMEKERKLRPKAEQEALKEFFSEDVSEERKPASEEPPVKMHTGESSEKTVTDLNEAREALLSQKKKIEKIQKTSEEKINLKKEKERLKKQKKSAAEERAKIEKTRKAQEKARKAALKRKNEKAAEMGGGIVKVNGVEIKTELNPMPDFSWKDFFGFKSKKERLVAGSEEQEALREELEAKREEARAAAEILTRLRHEKYERSFLGRNMRKIGTYCERHKKILLTAFAVLIAISVSVAGVFNYYTAYEYAYNGKILGLVKEKDTVLRVTDLVQGALTEDKNMDVVIDAKDDISFKRVKAMGDVHIDSSEDVLKRLTYMGDVNVKAYGIYVDGRKIGAVENKETAADVMQNIKDKYTSNYKESEVEEAVFIEKVDVRKSNTPLENVLSEDEMVDRLCTSGEKETLHKVVVGETFADIAKLYSMTEEELLKDNESVDPKKLEVGSTIKIKQNAPVLTVKITELVTYEKVIKHKVDKRDDKGIYEGYSETKQKGKNGLNEITSRLVTVNGETIEETPLVTTVKKKPVTEVIMVGVKERPPTVGSGKYIWPTNGSYTLTSNFGSRWGRSHEGIDLGCSVGTDVLAADGGTVTVAGYTGGYGYLVEIDHQNGQVTRYGHNSSLLVSVGDKVFQGQQIAESGNTGRSTGPHIHFEIRVNGVAQNPLNYLP